MGNIKSQLCRGFVKSLLMSAASWSIATSGAYAGTDSIKEIAAPKVEAKADDIKKSDDFQKPDWLKEVSITFKEGYDSNIYMADFGSLANKDSWVTTVIPKVGIDFAPLIEQDSGEKSVETFRLTYSPEISIYHGAESEDNTAHKIASLLKGRVGDFSYGVDNGFTYVDGRKQSLDSLYNGASASADISPYSSGSFRERRDQFQDKFKSYLRYDVSDEYFVRTVTTGQWYDLHVEPRTDPGYVNFPDRYDANAGVDLGYKMNPLTGLTSIEGLSHDYALTLGFRYGHTQQQMIYTPVGVGSLVQYKSDYQRVLAGIEGSPFKWLRIDFQVGPDFRNYGRGFPTINGASSATTSSGFYAANNTSFYAEGSATVNLTSVDSLVFMGKQWQWVASTGQGVYEDKSYDFSYRRKITPDLTGTAGYRYNGGEYFAPSSRDDNLYTFYGGLAYKIDENWSTTLDYSFGRGISDDSVARARESDRHFVVCGVKWSL